ERQAGGGVLAASERRVASRQRAGDDRPRAARTAGDAHPRLSPRTRPPPRLFPGASGPVALGLERPELLGTLTLGYLLDSARAESFKALTGAEVAFAIDGQVRASTLGPEAHARLSGLLGAEIVPRTMIGGNEYASLVRALHAP